MQTAASIHVGNITNSYGVAIGPGAQAVVNIYEGAAFPRPRYRSSVDDLITYYTGVFVGRDHESQVLFDFVNLAPPGYLLVQADVAMGKSAWMASLIGRWERGAWPTPSLDLIFFFVRQQGGRNTPIHFLQNVNAQLLDVLGVPGGVPPDLPSLQSQLGQLWAAAIDRADRQNRPLVFLVDGLDEGATQKPAIVELLPTALRPHVHVIVTSRSNPNPMTMVDVSHPLRLAQPIVLWPLIEDEIKALLNAQPSPHSLTSLAARVWDVTNGEPLLARFVSQEIAQHGEGALQRLEKEAPHGVEAYFRLQLDQLDVAAEDSELTWDILGLLVVALSALTLDDLAEALDVPRRKIRSALAPIQRFLLREGEAELMHQQFHDLLVEEFTSKELKTLRQQLIAFCARWPEHESPYAFRFYAQHLAALSAEDAAASHQVTASLVDLVLDQNFQRAHLLVTTDMTALQRDLDRAIVCAAHNHTIDPADALRLLVRAAYGRVDFLDNRVRADPLFEQARRGELATARRHIDVFPIERKWQQATVLALAWVAADSHPAAAQAVVEDLLPELSEGILVVMAQRVLGAIQRQPPAIDYGWLPNPPSETMIQRMIGRFGGEALPSGLEPLHHEGYELRGQLSPRVNENISISPIDAHLMDEGGFGEGPVYVASVDGLHLTAFAVADPSTREPGRRYFEQYVDLHASNGYAYYRNVSLWFLLDAALRHPEDGWSRPIVERIVMAALLGKEVAFREALPIAQMALRRKAGNAEADKGWTARTQRALAEVGQLSPQRGEGDIWGRHKRVLVALAEANAVLFERKEAESLLNLAQQMPRGYAGFLAPSWLTLAESLHIAQAAYLIPNALHEALTAAHNIQEEVFCVRSTARVNAMRDLWWNGAVPFDAVDVTRRLADDPNRPEFGARHVIGEGYALRGIGPDNLPLRNEVYTANTLVQLAQIYQRPLADFMRVNRAVGWEPDHVLPVGAAVQVPDPDFAPLLAARLSAELLTAPFIAQAAKVATLQMLTPIAAANPTALDTVLARLFLAAQPGNMDSFAGLIPLP